MLSRLKKEFELAPLQQSNEVVPFRTKRELSRVSILRWVASGTCAIFMALAGCGESSTKPAPKATSEASCKMEPRDAAAPAEAAALTSNDLSHTAEPSLALAEGDVFYDVQIKPILKNSCESCHSGLYQPTINTYQLAKQNVSAILSTVRDGDPLPMPPSPAAPLEPDQIALIEKWTATNLQQKPATPNEQLKPGGSGAGSTPPADGQTTAESDTPAAIDSSSFRITCGENLEVLNHSSDAYASHPLLKRDQVSTCHREGFLYDRNEKKCSEARLSTSFRCDRQGLIDAFDATPLSINQILDKALGKADDPKDYGEFYSIDQCGEIGIGEPVAYLIRLVTIDNEVQLQVKELKVEEE